MSKRINGSHESRKATINKQLTQCDQSFCLVTNIYDDAFCENS